MFKFCKTKSVQILNCYTAILYNLIILLFFGLLQRFDSNKLVKNKKQNKMKNRALPRLYSPLPEIKNYLAI